MGPPSQRLRWIKGNGGMQKDKRQKTKDKSKKTKVEKLKD
jgi:hypothetical protein